MIIAGDATELPIKSNSVACIVTSPPYNLEVDYPAYKDSLTWPEYLNMASKATREMYRVLVPGGRCWINVQPTVPSGDALGSREDLLSFWMSAYMKAKFRYRDITVWIQDSHDGACAWGSWLLPSAPNQRGSHEMILCLYKGAWHRERPAGVDRAWRDPKDALGGRWTDLVRNVWTIPPSRNKDYPATFPLDVPARCIRLSTWPGEIVLDPFAGSGTTVTAAQQLGRIGVGVDIGA